MLSADKNFNKDQKDKPGYAICQWVGNDDFFCDVKVQKNMLIKDLGARK